MASSRARLRVTALEYNQRLFNHEKRLTNAQEKADAAVAELAALEEQWTESKQDFAAAQELAADLATQRAKIADAVKLAGDAAGDLQYMPTHYAELFTDLKALVPADPETAVTTADVEAVNLDAHVEQMKTEYADLLTEAQGVYEALSAL